MSGAIHAELSDQGYDISGVVSWSKRKEYYAIGFEASELPDEVLGFDAIDDPDL